MKKNISKKRGFTLIELLVVVSIFSILTMIVLFKNSQFNSVITLENLAYEVALSIRQAQVFGLSAREVSISPGEFDVAYGLRFAQNSNSYFFFADLDNNRTFVDSETIETFSLISGFTISSICGSPTSQSCTETTVFLDVSYLRPEPEALLRRGNGTIWKYSEIHLSDNDGNERIIVVLPSGQISVQQ